MLLEKVDVFASEFSFLCSLKYWSCCVKRTTDFDSFLEQVGCSTGNHKWYKDDEEVHTIKSFSLFSQVLSMFITVSDPSFGIPNVLKNKHFSGS